jgi:hypothetical protein
VLVSRDANIGGELQDSAADQAASRTDQLAQSCHVTGENLEHQDIVAYDGGGDGQKKVCMFRICKNIYLMMTKPSSSQKNLEVLHRTLL